MDEIISRIQSGKMNLLKIVLKADTKGSIEAIKQMLNQIDNTEVGIKIIHSATGSISESDIMMAAASKGIVIGFNVKIDSRISLMAEKENVEVQNYSVIYNLMNDIKKILTGMLTDEEIEIETGKAEIKAIFMTAKKKIIIGAKVTEGLLCLNGVVKIYRAKEHIATTKIKNLKSFDKNVNEIKAENECGIEFPKKINCLESDIIICTRMEKKIKTL